MNQRSIVWAFVILTFVLLVSPSTTMAQSDLSTNDPELSGKLDRLIEAVEASSQSTLFDWLAIFGTIVGAILAAAISAYVAFKGVRKQIDASADVTRSQNQTNMNATILEIETSHESNRLLRELDIVTEKLNRFYRPLYRVSQASDEIYEKFCENNNRHRDDYFGLNEKKKKDELNETKLPAVFAWQKAMTTSFAGLNDEQEKLVKEHAGIIDPFDGERFPTVLSDLVNHFTELRVLIHNWPKDGGQVGELIRTKGTDGFKPNKRYPGELLSYLETEIERLESEEDRIKNEQRQLIEKLKEGSPFTKSKSTDSADEAQARVGSEVDISAAGFQNEEIEERTPSKAK